MGALVPLHKMGNFWFGLGMLTKIDDHINSAGIKKF